jgi:hypothetical protein
VKKILLYIISVLLCGSLSAQTDSIRKESLLIAGSFVDFQVDNLGDLFLLTPQNQLKKYNGSGDSLSVFNDVRRYGKIAYMDVTNPLKILLFYQEFGTIVMLDRFLNNINSIDLRQLGFYQVTCIGLAYDNNIWVYDALAGQLNKIASDGTLVSQTNDIRQFTDSVPDPTLLSDQGGLVYLYDPQEGAFVFDHYGGFQKLIPLRNWRHFSVINNTLLGWNGHEFLKYEDKVMYAEEKKQIPNYFLPAVKILIMPDYLYVLKSDGIHVFKN